MRSQWHKPQKQRLKNQLIRTEGGKTQTYTLLYFVPGLITYCGIRGIPVMTGFMSGCYLFRYRSRGELRAAHIGTHDTNEEWSNRAKSVWKSYVARNHITDVYGFDPLKDVSTKLLNAAVKIGTPEVVGMWDGNGAARIGVMANPRGKFSKKVLVGVETARLRPWSSIQHDAKMR